MRNTRGKARVQFGAILTLECLIYSSKYVREAAEYKNLELAGEVRTGFINLMVIRLLLIFNAIRLWPR